MPRINATATALLCALALSACATPLPPPCEPVSVPPPSLPPAPANVMVERLANFRTRLLNFFSTSPSTPTTPPASSPPASE